MSIFGNIFIIIFVYVNKGSINTFYFISGFTNLGGHCCLRKSLFVFWFNEKNSYYVSQDALELWPRHALNSQSSCFCFPRTRTAGSSLHAQLSPRSCHLHFVTLSKKQHSLTEAFLSVLALVFISWSSLGDSQLCSLAQT